MKSTMRIATMLSIAFGSLVLVIATALVVLILYSREFKSDVLHVLRD